jgi:hypothetical protein
MNFAYLKNRYFPIFLGVMLMLFHFLSAYPGGMSYDSFVQYQQSLDGNFLSSHPPLMAMVWSLFHNIYQGPQTMLCFHLALLWSGVLLLFYADETNKYRKLYFILPFVPMILSQSGTIWKDVGFSFSVFFITSACIFYTYRKKYTSTPVFVGLLLICFYAVGIKFQAQFIIPIVIYFIISIYLNAKIVLKLVLCSIISVIIIWSNLFLINNFSINTHFYQIRQFFDIAGVSVRINDDSIIPEYVRKLPIYNFEKLKSAYTPQLVNAITFTPETKVYEMTLDENDLKEINLAFFNAVKKHPIMYLQHRGVNFFYNMNSVKFTDYALVESNLSTAKNVKIHQFEKNRLKRLITKILSRIPSILTRNIICFLIGIIYALHYIKHFKNNSPELVILKYITLIIMVHTITLFFTTMAPDYRYFYIVRMLSLFTLPIYLKSVSQQSIK